VDRSFRVTGPLLDVLEVLLDASEELHGWAIMKATTRSGPTVYQVLERLTEAGWVTARWEALHPEPGRPRRRFYRLDRAALPAARALLRERRPRPEPAPRLRPSLGSEL
jgi:PadR family transcriptional regulator, regulatory protein PadR